MNTFPKEKLEKTAAALLAKAGLRPEDALQAAEVIIQSDLSGVDSHGLSRLALYLGRIRQGMVNTAPKIGIISETESSLILDCDNGLGVATVPRALELALKKARGAGALACVMRNSNHYGVGNYYALKSISENMICLLCTSTTPSMAPTGGVELLIGSNPVTVGVPAGKARAVILDMASSNVAMGKLQAMLREKQKIPFGWAITQDGRPTDDPAEAVLGSLLPIAGYKGYGLAVIVDILSALLSGAAVGPEIGRLDGRGPLKPEEIGHFLLLINVEKFRPVAEFKAAVDSYVELLKTSKKAEGVPEIFLPGEIELKKMAQRSAEGIAVTEALGEQLSAQARELGLAGPEDDFAALVKKFAG
ncbi:MAG: Ldh family oxidoreductase [Candidatus Adiutrix sp.]|jgi:LDH2 family malate/lactate/ureidoglycolate dehydrogenase|nr:Ldh family oxidoreductase [Candidatus Adiutrix sp.]